jgi:hypothetical protein
MEFEIGYLLSLILIGISFLGFFLALMIDEINKVKGIIMCILSLILFGLGVYSYIVVGQWQKVKGGKDINRLNYYLNIYRESPLPEIMPY